MLKELLKTKEWILDILLPRFCVGCGREGLYICKDCEIFLSEVDSLSTCEVNAKTSQVNGIVSVWEYEGLMEKLIYKIKFDGRYDIIGELVDKAMEKVELNLPADTIITFVPMWKKKERQRGFNQAGLIARKLGLLLSRTKQQPFKVLPLLEKVGDNRSQVGLGPKEREENAKGVFRFKTSDVSALTSEVPSDVLLVDDVYTTGATMNECKRVLKKAGAKNIWGFTLARKLRL